MVYLHYAEASGCESFCLTRGLQLANSESGGIGYVRESVYAAQDVLLCPQPLARPKCTVMQRLIAAFSSAAY